MPNGSFSAIVEYLRQIAGRGPAAELTDGQLLERFIAQRDECAFSTLVQRHGPLVLTVCRRVLHNHHDVEDAFQATFLVLVRKAGSIAKRESVASWLHGVAHRTALRAKIGMTRRQRLESQVQRPAAPDCMQEVILQDLRLMLDEEVQRLPERYRLPFVLCYMEGKTNEEAAMVLGCPKGTILSRLSRAREKLRRRLTRRGLGLSAGLIATMLSQSAVSAAVPASLADSTIKAAQAFAGGTAAAGVISANVATLTRGVLQAMFLTKLKIAATVILTLGLIGGGSSMLGLPILAEKHSSAQKDEKSKKEAKQPTKRQGNNRAQAEMPFENAFGFGWLSQPNETDLGMKGTQMTAGGGVAWIPEKKDGALVITLAHVGGGGRGDRQYRPVVLDSDRNRYLPYAMVSGGSDAGGMTVSMQRYLLDVKTLPPEKVKYIGIEFSTPEGRKAISKLAIARAKADGIPILPYPELGEPFDFELPTMDGKRINSRDLRGKVLLIECWTVGSIPLMEKMPGLKKLYEKRKKDGFEIIGVNFDRSAEAVTDAGELRGLTWPKVSQGLPWPQVQMPNDDKIRELWDNAEHLGRLYLIDRQGILQADCFPDELFGSINKLLDSKKKLKD